MINLFFRRGVLKVLLLALLSPLLFTSCILNKQLPDASNDFQAMVQTLIEESYPKMKPYLGNREIVLVPDFVNLDRLTNKSKLGFLLSDSLKNSLLNKDIVVRAIEMGKVFKIGPSGFNVLTRKHNEIDNTVTNEKYAVVGTYTITTKRLILFVKLIDIQNGTILASATSSTIVDEEITELERTPNAARAVVAPLTL